MPNTVLDGVADIDLDASGAGDTLSTLVASMSGGGNLTVVKGNFAKLDFSGLNTATEKLDADKDPIDQKKVRDQLSSLLDRAPLALSSVGATVTLSNGVARVGPLQINRPPYSLQGTLNVDLKSLKVDSRFNLYTDQGPANWSGPLPQIGMAYRTNAQNALEREIDASTLSNILTTRQVTRELQRLEAQQKEQLRIELLQYDQRERVYFEKRIKLGRDLDERARKAAEAQKLAEEQKQAEEAKKVQEEEKKAQQDFFNAIQKSIVPLPPILQPSTPLPPLPQGSIVLPQETESDPAEQLDPLAAP